MRNLFLLLLLFAAPLSAQTMDTTVLVKTRMVPVYDSIITIKSRVTPPDTVKPPTPIVGLTVVPMPNVPIAAGEDVRFTFEINSKAQRIKVWRNGAVALDVNAAIGTMPFAYVAFPTTRFGTPYDMTEYVSDLVISGSN